MASVADQLASNLKHERHNNTGELIYWNNQWKLLAQQAAKELATAKREAVEAFVKAVYARFANDPRKTGGAMFDILTYAIENERREWLK